MWLCDRLCGVADVWLVIVCCVWWVSVQFGVLFCSVLCCLALFGVDWCCVVLVGFGLVMFGVVGCCVVLFVIV